MTRCCGLGVGQRDRALVPSPGDNRQCQLTRQSAGQPPGRLHTAEEEERQKLQGAGVGASLTAHWCRSHSRDTGSTPGSGRSPGEENGYPLWYSCWDNPWIEELGGLTVCGVTKSRIQLNTRVYWSEGDSQLRKQTGVSCIAGRFFTN